MRNFSQPQYPQFGYNYPGQMNANYNQFIPSTNKKICA